jgi:hypothetical protein
MAPTTVAKSLGEQLRKLMEGLRRAIRNPSQGISASVRPDSYD